MTTQGHSWPLVSAQAVESIAYSETKGVLDQTQRMQPAVSVLLGRIKGKCCRHARPVTQLNRAKESNAQLDTIPIRPLTDSILRVLCQSHHFVEGFDIYEVSFAWINAPDYTSCKL